VRNLFWSVNLDCVFVTYCWDFRCIFVIFTSIFQITKGLRFNSYPVSLPIFSSFPLAVNPVGVIKYWCYFSQIIVYNLVTIYGIITKFGIRMHPYPDFQCTKFLGNQIIALCFIATFTPWWKEKKAKKLVNFWRLISRKRLAWFSWNLKCEVMTLASIFSAKMV